MLINRNTIASLALVATGLSATPSVADSVMSSWLGPTQPITIYGHEEWAAAVKEATGGEVDIRLVLGGALIPAAATTQGIADGVAQIGLVSAAYTPSELSVANALGDLGFATPDPMVLAFAYADFMMNEPMGYGEWRNNGVIYAGAHSTPSYHFICKEELSTVADFAGKRIRLFGGGWARFAEEKLGAVSVNMTFGEIYTGLERGALDCVAADPTVLTSGPSIKELVTGFTNVALSPYYTNATWIYNVDFWQGLTDAQRRAIFDESAKALARLHVKYAAQVDASLSEATADGVTIVNSDELQAAYEEWVAGDSATAKELAKSKFGIEDPEALHATFQTYIDKWKGLMGDMDRTDEAALAALLKANLYDPIDVSTYGME